jgi:hypothetical protein
MIRRNLNLYIWNYSNTILNISSEKSLNPKNKNLLLPGKVQTNSIFSPLSHFTLALKKSANTSVRMRVREKRKSANLYRLRFSF